MLRVWVAVGIEDMEVEMRRRSAKRAADISIKWKLLNIYGESETANYAA